MNGQAAQIVIVEDESIVALDLERYLREFGYSVVGIANSGESALEQVRDSQPNLVLMDIRLKGRMDGIETAQHLLKDYDIPIIFLTAHTDMHTLSRAQKIAPYGFLTKPFRERELHSTIEMALYKHAVEKKIHDSERKYRTLFETMAQGVVYQNAAGEITAANPAAERILGLTLDQLQGRTPIDERWQAVHKDGSAFPEEEHPALIALKTGKPVHDVVMGIFNPLFDELHWINICSIPQFQPGEKKPYQVFTTFEDITEKHQLTIKQRHLIKDLDAFAHTVAHDLKAPLQVILGFADLLITDLQEELSEPIVTSLTSIAEYAHKMNQIVEGLLLLSSIRNVDVAITAIDMDSVVTEVLRNFAPMIAELNATIIVPDDWPVVAGNQDWLERVWSNYINNALKYGGSPPVIELGADSLTDSTARLWIKDNGKGIPLADQDLLFKPLSKLESNKEDSHGLGLSIVKRIVNKLGGEVGIESTPDEGSLFYFTLPLYTES